MCSLPRAQPARCQDAARAPLWDLSAEKGPRHAERKAGQQDKDEQGVCLGRCSLGAQGSGTGLGSSRPLPVQGNVLRPEGRRPVQATGRPLEWEACSGGRGQGRHPRDSTTAEFPSTPALPLEAPDPKG